MKTRVMFVDETSGIEEPFSEIYVITVPRVNDYVYFTVSSGHCMYKVTKVIQQLFESYYEAECFEVHLVKA